MILAKAFFLAAALYALAGPPAHAAAPRPAEILPVTLASLDGTPLPATLIKPAGDGPFPAVVIMHDCSGLGRQSSGAPRRWADDLVSLGYVTLMPDSFAPRGLAAGVCTAPAEQSRAAGFDVRQSDAYAALAMLRTAAFVDAGRVGIMGGSHGGSTTLATMVESTGRDDALSAAKRAGFSAAIALYPGCANRYGNWSALRQKGAPHMIAGYRGVYAPLAPLLILIGEKDDWTPAEPCRRLVETGRAAGHPLSIRIYPGAHHAFDSTSPIRYNAQRNNSNSPGGKGATTGGNADAWADARQEVGAFFKLHLKNAP